MNLDVVDPFVLTQKKFSVQAFGILLIAVHPIAHWVVVKILRIYIIVNTLKENVSAKVEGLLVDIVQVLFPATLLTKNNPTTTLGFFHCSKASNFSFALLSFQYTE